MGGADNNNEHVSTLTSQLFNNDKNNMNFIIFEAVENPYEILELAKKQRINLIPDKPIYNNYREKQTEVKVGGQKVIIYDNPKWVWLLISGIIMVALVFPILDMVHTLKIWNKYIKTTATILNIEERVNNARSENTNIKYFVNISYTLDSKTYESIITNDKGHLKSIQNDMLGTIHFSKYNSRFRKMKKNDKINIFVNPKSPEDVEFVPTLLPSSSVLFLCIGIVGSIFIVASIKSKMKKC